MGAIVQKLLFKDNTYDTPPEPQASQNILGASVTNIEGEQCKLGDLMKGYKLTIIVNVASKWAFAHKSYVELVNVYEEYKAYGMQVIAFPCSQFLDQEVKTDAEVIEYARNQMGAMFPLM